MEDGYIAVTGNTVIEERRAPVDIFFRTLADEHGPRAVAVILSGTGANGSMGLKRVKERGGACFVQTPHEAEFSEMPRNAIATEMVDEVMSVSKIPEKILLFKTNLGTVEITEDAEKRPEEQQQALREIFTQLRLRTGHDFSNYKRPTLLRRIERRVNIRNLPDLPAYAKYFLDNADESMALLKDLLISVTNFFRDKKPFEIIEQEILPKIFKDKTGNDQVRIWVAGCATGEEAYSLAMLCMEKTMSIIDAPKVQIFATDIDEHAIAVAREGLYTLNDVADVSPERLRHFFIKENDYYRVRREIREMVLFATHNFLKDPPFSHLDLIACRNVMIYLNSIAQERVIETFHFALVPAGYLFLGTSETVDGAHDLYAVYSRENHIFQSRQVKAKSYPVPELRPYLHTDRRKNETPSQPVQSKLHERISYGDLHRQSLEEYAPPSLIVNEEYDILHLTENVGKYLRFAGGEPSQNLLQVIKPELRLELRSALYQAGQHQIPVQATRLRIGIDKETETINIHVRPVLGTGDKAKRFFLVLFEPADENGQQQVTLSNSEPVAKQLEEELIWLKAQLRASNEQNDLHAEEMKASNEEWQAMNEELRSANEELETSKEELQSINEEMRTVNQELKVKIGETSIVSNNLRNLVKSTDIGTIFLDRSLKVVFFTPSAREIFNLIPADYGRSLSDITSNLEHTGLLHDAETVLDKLTTIEKELRLKSGAVYLMRITPYRTDEDRIKGVVITFLNITARKQVEEEVKKSEQRLQRMVNVPQVGVLTFNHQGVMLHANDAFLEMLGFTREEFNARQFNWRDFTPVEYVEASMNILKQLEKTGRGGPYEKEYFAKDGSKIWLMFVAADLGDGTIVEYAVDISARKKLEGTLRISEEKYRTMFETMAEGFGMCELIRDETGKAVDWQFLELNPALEKHTGMRVETSVNRPFSELFPGVDRRYWVELYADVVDNKTIRTFENYWAPIDRWLADTATPVGNDRFNIIYEDVTERKNNEQRQAFLLKFSDAIRPLTDPKEIRSTAMQLLGEHLGVNRAAYVDAVNKPDTMKVISDYTRDVEQWVGMISLSDFGAALGKDFTEGKTVAIANIQTDERFADSRSTYTSLDIAAAVGVPLLKNGQVVAAMGVHNKTPRNWATHEISIIEEVAERTWAAVVRAKAEESLRESEARLSAVFDVAPAGLALADASGKILRFNKALHRIWGSPPMPESTEQYAEWKARWADTGEPLKADDWAMARALNTGEIVPGDVVKIERFEGGSAIIINAAAPIRDAAGNIIGGIVAEVDITAQQQAETALRESEETFRSYVTASSDIIYRMSADWKTMYSMDGKNVLSHASNTTNWMDDYIPNHEKERVQSAIDKAISAKTMFALEHEVINTDGSLSWVYSRAVPRLDRQGRIVDWTGAASDTTERKEAEKALRESEERLRLATTAANIYSWEYNANTGTYSFSENAAAILGVSRLPHNAEDSFKLVYPEDKKLIKDQLETSIKEGKGFHVDFRSVKENGDIIWLSVQTTVITDATGKASRLLGIAQDISERKKGEEALRGSEERLQKATQIETVGVVFFDDEGSILQANQAFLDMSGYTIEQVHDLHVRLKDITPQEWVPVMEKAVHEITTKGITSPYEKELIRYDGSRFWALCAKARIGENDNVEYIIDVTKRRQAEEALYQSEERYRIALQSADMAAWDWNIKDDRIIWNDQHFYLFGVMPTDEELRSSYFLEFVRKDDLSRIADSLVHAIKETGIYREEFRIIRTGDRKLRWMSGYGKAVTKENGNATRMIGVMYDITERKKLEQQKEDFISIASHELKTPVTSIKAYAEVLHEMFEESNDASSAALMEKMDTQVDRLIDLIRALLDTSKLSEGELSLNFEKFDLHNLIEERGQDLQRLSLSHNLVLPNAKETFVTADRERIGQVLTNLISNAIKYSPKGGDVIIGLKMITGAVQVSVKDNGMGIPKELHEKVFERFFRVKTEQMKNYPGMGLGLYITAYIVQKHGGKIWLESKEGEGTTFYFTLPAND
ncbi:MAG: PAS domain S-box protein [Williamsia sp.]|nr:PAS domain S-box protein [Williamsia sp.]